MNGRSILALLCVLAAPPYAAAEAYPARTVRIVVPYAAGGGVDIVTRSVGQKLADYLGQSVLTENRPGGNANIASEYVAKAPADGYVLLMASPANATNASLFSRLPYDLLRDFAPVIQVGYAPLVLAVHPSVPATSVRELLALARRQPGQLSYASGGTGTSQHLAGEMFKLQGGVSVLHVPYKGAAPALVDIVGGQVAFMFNNTLEIAPYAQAGRVRVLAVASAQRTPGLPAVPTFAESGMPDFEASVWWGIIAPAATPRNIVNRLNSDANKALQAREVRERLTGLGAEIVGGTPEQFGTFLRGEVTKWANVIKKAGIKAD